MMAEEASEVPQSVEGSAQDMELDTGSTGNPEDSGAGNQPNGADKPEVSAGGGLKRGKEEGDDAEAADEEGVSKKQKVEASVEEERLEKLEEKKEGGEDSKEEEEKEGGGGGEDGENTASVSLGLKVFGSSTEMFDYFYKFLHFWSPNLDVNKYEHIMLLELLKKGHAEPDKKIGEGIQAFQIRYHQKWKSRCFFLVHVDGTSDDFSFRKCVDHILPLPENLKTPSDGNKSLDFKKGGDQGGRGGRGGRGGFGRGGRWRGRRGGK